jgi:hypothetical protein
MPVDIAAALLTLTPLTSSHVFRLETFCSVPKHLYSVVRCALSLFPLYFQSFRPLAHRLLYRAGRLAEA